MKLSDFKTKLNTVDRLSFILPNGQFVPNHFHVTEVGQITKHFIDCGGTVRDEKTVNFQLWEADGDHDHRLAPEKLNKIIALSEKVLNIQDGEIEVEYQTDTIGKYSVEFDGVNFMLTSKRTACLASDNCGTNSKKKVNLAELQSDEKVCCAPGGGCC